MAKKNFFLALVLLWAWVGKAQNFNWWNETHNWDGITPWSDYIITAPGFMGPNALPVPFLQNGLIPQEAFLEIGAESHRGMGDRTQNLSTRLFLPLFSSRVGLNLNMVPVEWFNTQVQTRDKRRARTRSGQGTAVGDVYVGTYIQLVQNKAHMPDILLTINLKTASGNQLQNARFTDAPGYFFDLSAGKKITFKNSFIKHLRPHGMAGLYVWQMQGDGYFQNDAILYGLGVDLKMKKLMLTNSICGYQGYIGNGDRALVYRFQVNTSFLSLLNYSFGFQKGFQDYAYTTFRVGCQLNLQKLSPTFFRQE
jgi:hypothetical protein